MSERVLQVWWNEKLPMRPRCEHVSGAIAEVAKRAVGKRAHIVRTGARIVAVGDGALVEIDVTRPSAGWRARPLAVEYASGPSIDGPPLMIGPRGEVFALQSDLSLRAIWKQGIDSARPIPNGWTLLHQARRIVFGNLLVDANGTIKWRIRSHEYYRVALEDVLLSVLDGGRLECRCTETAEVRWVRAGGTPQAIVDDTVWFIDGTCLVARELEGGEERARIDVHKLAADLVVDERGCGHLLARGLYWTVDLRTARVLTRYELIDPPRDMYTVLPLEGGLLVRTSEHALYRLEPRDGKGTLPAPLWRSPVLISETVPFQDGLVVKTDGPCEQAIHWLAPA